MTQGVQQSRLINSEKIQSHTRCARLEIAPVISKFLHSVEVQHGMELPASLATKLREFLLAHEAFEQNSKSPRLFKESKLED